MTYSNKHLYSRLQACLLTRCLAFASTIFCNPSFKLHQTHTDIHRTPSAPAATEVGRRMSWTDVVKKTINGYGVTPSISACNSSPEPSVGSPTKSDESLEPLPSDVKYTTGVAWKSPSKLNWISSTSSSSSDSSVNEFPTSNQSVSFEFTSSPGCQSSASRELDTCSTTSSSSSKSVSSSGRNDRTMDADPSRKEEKCLDFIAFGDLTRDESSLNWADECDDLPIDRNPEMFQLSKFLSSTTASNTSHSSQPATLDSAISNRPPLGQTSSSNLSNGEKAAQKKTWAARLKSSPPRKVPSPEELCLKQQKAKELRENLKNTKVMKIRSWDAAAQSATQRRRQQEENRLIKLKDQVNRKQLHIAKKAQEKQQTIRQKQATQLSKTRKVESFKTSKVAEEQELRKEMKEKLNKANERHEEHLESVKEKAANVVEKARVGSLILIRRDNEKWKTYN
ncbi:hypothetical protein BKA69DRAFT_159869 [Paraphysoderma sedebokerense]|nr:hypothetical protein BKA69DRAFT_159869 [Paraphysoderma sedebokerense]